MNMIAKLFAIALIATTAQAAPIIRLSDGVATVTVADGSVQDINAAAGAVTYLGTVGADWFLNITTGVSNSPVPDATLSSVNASSSASGTFLDVLLTDTGFTLGSGAALASFLGSIGGTTVGMVTWWLYVDDGNAAFAESLLIGTGTNSGGNPFSDTFSGLAALTDTFSMTLRTRINHGNVGGHPDVTTFGFTGSGTRPVPEPGTLLLMAAGLLVWFNRNRREANS